MDVPCYFCGKAIPESRLRAFSHFCSSACALVVAAEYGHATEQECEVDLALFTWYPEGPVWTEEADIVMVTVEGLGPYQAKFINPFGFAFARETMVQLCWDLAHGVTSIKMDGEAIWYWDQEYKEWRLFRHARKHYFLDRFGVEPVDE